MIVIDNKLGGYMHDLTLNSVVVAAERWTSSSSCVGVFHSVPCSQWCAIRCRGDGGPPQLFSRDYPDGISGPTGVVPPTASNAVLLAANCLKICRAAIRCGTPAIGENPVSRGQGSPWAIVGHETHSSFYDLIVVKEFQTDTGSEE